MPLKIAYVSIMLAPFDEGGPGTVAHYMLREFGKMPEVEVTLIVAGSASEGEIRSEHGCKIRNIIMLPENRSQQAYLRLFTKKTREIWKAFEDVDLIHLNSYYHLRHFYFPFFALLRLKPVVLTWHGISIPQDIFQGEKAQIAKTIAYHAISAINSLMWSRVIVNSESIRSLASNYLDARKITLIRNGVPNDEIRRAKEIDLDGQVKLLFVGRLIPIKGVDLLLKAFAVLRNLTNKNIQLYIVGSGTHESIYKQLASQMQIDDKVHFLGHLPLEECYSLFKSCSILVLPSRFESAPMTLLEGMAAGVPIVATNVGGIPEIIRNGRNGFLTKQNPVEIAERIHFLVDHQEIRQEISRNNLLESEKYTWHNIALEHIGLYKSLI